jgi:hypothetical protein
MRLAARRYHITVLTSRKLLRKHIAKKTEKVNTTRPNLKEENIHDIECVVTEHWLFACNVIQESVVESSKSLARADMHHFVSE